MPSSPIANDQINPSPGSSPALVGYAQLASKLSLDADLSIFRRFGELNVRNILYLQSELLELEQKLHRLDNEADKSRQDPTTWFKPRSYYYASRRQQKRSVGGGDGDSNEDGVNEYWDTVLKIREVLGQYSRYIISSSSVQYFHKSLSICLSVCPPGDAKKNVARYLHTNDMLRRIISCFRRSPP